MDSTSTIEQNTQLTPEVAHPKTPPSIEDLANSINEGKYGPKPTEILGIKVYQGDIHKMETFNNGENGQDRAVPFQLKRGEQGMSFAVSLKDSDPDTVINLDDSRKVSEMSPAQLQSTAVLTQVGNELVVSREDQEDVHLKPEEFADKKFRIDLDHNIAVEVLDFDPNTNRIIIHKVKKEPTSVRVERPVPTDEQKQSWMKRLVTLIPAGILTVSSVTGGGTVDANPLPPPPVVEQVPTGPGYENTPVVPIEQKTDEVDPSLKCEKTVDFEVKSGDSLTKALVEVNGLGRYLTTEGKLNVDKLYKDLVCMLAQEPNIEQVLKTDPVAGNFLKMVMSGENKDLIGPATATTIYDGLKALNTPERFDKTHDQLVVIQPGDNYKVPDFR